MSLAATALAAFLSAVNPWDLADPFPLPPTYASVLEYEGLTANLGYRAIFENFEVEGLETPRPYESWAFFHEANPFLRYALSKKAELKAGVRIKQRFGGGVTIQPRFAYVDDRLEHTFVFGNFRQSWTPGILYQPIAADDFLGVYGRLGRRPWRVEAFVARTAVAAEDQYESYVGAGRIRFQPVGFAFIEGQALISHAAGFDTAGLEFSRPEEPTEEVRQLGAYAELNIFGRNSGFHAEFQRAMGEAVWSGETFAPHGRYRAAGMHLTLLNVSAIGEYRRVDPTFVAPMGPLEYRELYPDDRLGLTPDAAVGLIRWYHPFHPKGSLLVEVEHKFFVQPYSWDIHGSQNRATVALQAAF